MEKPANATLGSIPQHGDFPFPEYGVRFNSDFDSGNLGRVEAQAADTFNLWTAPDCAETAAETKCRTWFYFLVEVTQPRQFTFLIKNLNQQGKLFKEGLRPVIKSQGSTWRSFPGAVTWRNNQGSFEVTMQTYLEAGEIYFAFCNPWSLEDSYQFTRLVGACVSSDTYFHRAPLVFSPEGRVCELVTISSFDSITNDSETRLPNLFPTGEPLAMRFAAEKPIVFVSARVHPGETPGSFMLNGLIKFIVSSDVRAVALRKNFVFKIIPVLNPDGVYRGHYRSDTFGENLNRVYLEPSLSESPTVYAVRELMTAYSQEGQVYCYIDLHGHAAKRGVFVYGNFMDYVRQVDSFLFPRLMALNCVNFDFEGCCFSEKNMRSKDKSDGKSKEGSGRVAFFKLQGLVRCYTLEANYASGKVLNSIPDTPLDLEPESRRSSEVYSNGPPPYTIEVLEDVGKAIGVSLLDSIDANPESRLKKTEHLNLRGLKAEVAMFVAKMAPFRFDPNFRKADSEKLMAFIDNGGKSPKEENKELNKPKRIPVNKRKLEELSKPRREIKPRRQEFKIKSLEDLQEIKEIEDEVVKVRVKFVPQRKELSVVSPTLDLSQGKTLDRKGSYFPPRNARSLSQHRKLERKRQGKPSLSQLLVDGRVSS